ncbi:uncharacterized protein LOC143601770 [Bidens hawaiensis]|uniref:uncharacterized protein LOC143601770 n=1 Tax=Bidens hawaiensis TaxID=980011 RepID=UPI00404922AB
MSNYGDFCYCEGPYHYRDCPVVAQNRQESCHGRRYMTTCYEDKEILSYYSHSEQHTSTNYDEDYQSDMDDQYDQEPYYANYTVESKLDKLINIMVDYNKESEQQRKSLEAKWTNQINKETIHTEPDWDEDDYEYSHEEDDYEEDDYEYSYEEDDYEYSQSVDEDQQNILHSKLDAIMNTLMEHKRQMMEEEKEYELTHERILASLNPNIEDKTEIKRDQEELASGTVSDGDEENEVVDLPKQESESVIQVEDTIPSEYEEPKVANVNPMPSPVLTIPNNKCGDEGLVKNKKKVSLQDIGQIIKKRPHNNHSSSMPITVKRLWTWHVSYRAHIGNSVGRCALRPP